jgi:hypothetical protein
MHAHESAGQGRDLDVLNDLLRGELAAVETYDRAIVRFENEPLATDLHRIRTEHQQAVVALRERIFQAGGRPAGGSGAWGAFASAVEGASPATAIAALAQGEKHGGNDYESALKNPNLDPACKALIRSDLLPKCQSHVAQLDQLMAGCS